MTEPEPDPLDEIDRADPNDLAQPEFVRMLIAKLRRLGVPWPAIKARLARRGVAPDDG